MPDCQCGNCQKKTRRTFAPGHDQRLRASLERRAGGLLSVRALVTAAEAYAQGKSTAEEMGREVRRIFLRREAPPTTDR